MKQTNNLFLSLSLQAFATFSERLSPMLAGCEENRSNWDSRIIDDEETTPISKSNADENDKENHDKDETDDRETDPLHPGDDE